MQLDVGFSPFWMIRIVAASINGSILGILDASCWRNWTGVRDLGSLERELRQGKPSLILVKFEL